MEQESFITIPREFRPLGMGSILDFLIIVQEKNKEINFKRVAIVFVTKAMKLFL